MIIKSLPYTEQKRIFDFNGPLDDLKQLQIKKVLENNLEILGTTSFVEVLINKKRQSDLEIVDLCLLMASLQRYKDHAKKSILQLKYCESSLRSRYIHAKLTK